MIANILSIAGSDPSGGAGIQADLKTFGAMGSYGMAVITALTAQNTRGVSAVHMLKADFVAAQIDAIFADIRVDAVKIGMLGSGEMASMVADRLVQHRAPNIVLDPVLVATSGDQLGDPDVVGMMRDRLYPLARLVTPNLFEAARLSGNEVAHDLATMEAAGRMLLAQGARAVLIKGGHLADERATDILLDGATTRRFEAVRIHTGNTHGTGCTLSSAIAAELGRGQSLAAAVAAAKAYLTLAISRADLLQVGGGHGPVNHFHALRPNAPGNDDAGGDAMA